MGKSTTLVTFEVNMEAAKLHLRAVTPIGQKQGYGFACGPNGGGLALLTTDEYPPHPTGQLVRDLRVTLGIALRDASKALGLTAVELSSLERGSAELADEVGGFQEVVRRFITMGHRERKVSL